MMYYVLFGLQLRMCEKVRCEHKRDIFKKIKYNLLILNRINSSSESSIGNNKLKQSILYECVYLLEIK